MLIQCPYCCSGAVDVESCLECGHRVNLTRGIPTTSVTKESDPMAEQLRTITRADEVGLETILSEIRENYMDGTVIDRFFKTQPTSWRFLVEKHLNGRGLVIGDHDESVGLLFGEVLEEVWVADTNFDRLAAQAAVARCRNLEIHPLHSDLDSLPFPEDVFNLIVLDIRADELGKAMNEIVQLLAEDGTLLVIVNGWPRELGVSGLVGMGDPPSDWRRRLKAGIRAWSDLLSKSLQKWELSINGQYALLSTDRHENQRVFDVRSQEALQWLLQGPDKTARTPSLRMARVIALLGQHLGVLEQCYPRYLFSCHFAEHKSSDGNIGLLIAGKNRSTIIEFDGSTIDVVRKIPNSHHQSPLNERAQSVTDRIGGSVSSTIPESKGQRTKFGFERREQPLSGTTLDQTIEATSESLEDHLEMVVDWLLELHRETRSRTVELTPADVETMLTDARFGLVDPAVPIEVPIKLPEVVTHGDFFGSNIYHDGEDVTGVIDWEWALPGGIPFVDLGFFLLQYAAFVGDSKGQDFAYGYKTVFIEDTDFGRVSGTALERYCEEFGLPINVFEAFLPLAYVERSRTDFQYNHRLDIDWPERVRIIWNQDTRLLNRVN